MSDVEGFLEEPSQGQHADAGLNAAVQTVLQVLPLLVLTAVQIYTSLKGPPKGPKKTVQEASDANDPTVFFDITIGGEPAGRIESERSQR